MPDREREAARAEQTAAKKREAADRDAQQKREKQTFEIEGQKVTVGDIIEIQKVPQQNQDTIHTTKGSFPSTIVPQELVEAYYETRDAQLEEAKTDPDKAPDAA